MVHKYRIEECNAEGIPYCQLAPTFLEKDGEKELFTSQQAVDEAWADGWHVPGQPETADEDSEPIGEPEPDPEDEPGADVKLKYMTKKQLVTLAEARYGLNLDSRKSLRALVDEVKAHEEKIEEERGILRGG